MNLIIYLEGEAGSIDLRFDKERLRIIPGTKISVHAEEGRHSLSYSFLGRGGQKVSLRILTEGGAEWSHHWQLPSSGALIGVRTLTVSEGDVRVGDDEWPGPRFK